MKKQILIISTLCAVLTAGARQTADSVYTVDECVQMALLNSKDAQNAQNDIESAVSLRREAFTKYFPEIAAVGMIFWANHDILQYNVLDILELGIIKNGKLAGVQAMQPVFTGGQIVNGNKLAAVGEEVARIRKTQTDNDLRLNTSKFFWKLAALQATKNTLNAAIETLDSLENQVGVAVEAGIVTRNDLMKVRLKRNTYRSELVDLDNGIQLVKMLLGQYMGLGTSAAFEIAASVPDVTPEFPYELFMTPGDALAHTPNYQLLGKNVEAKRLEKRMELGKNLPTVAVGAGWYYHDLLEQNHNFGMVQIGVAVPVSGWWGGSYAMKRKALALKNAENEREDLGQKLMIQIQDKWNNLTAAHRKMQIEHESIEQSRENYRLNSMYYEAGMSTMTELLEAETSLSESQTRFIAAYGAYCSALSEYLIATGR